MSSQRSKRRKTQIDTNLIMILLSYRDKLLQLGRRVQNEAAESSPADLMQFSEELGPSQLFSTGGLLFDFWFILLGPKKHHPNTRQCQLWTKPGDWNTNLPTTLSFHFYSWLIIALKTLSNKNTKHVMHLGMFLDWKGLSAEGRSVMAKMNLIPTPESYRLWKQAIAEDQSKVIKIKMRNEVTVFWLDNYNKQWFNKALSNTKSNPVKTANMTGVAFLDVSKQVSPRDIILKKKNTQTIQAIPDEISEDIVFKLCKQYDSIFKLNVGGTGPLWQNYKSRSVTEKHNIRTDIPRPIVSDEHQISITAEMEANFKTSGSLSDWFPVDIFPENCGENAGLDEVLKRIGSLYNWQKQKRYFFGMCDLGIFPRAFSAMKNSDSTLRKKVCLLLGFWHPLKHCCEVVWTHLGPKFLAGAWFSIFPRSKFIKAPKLLQMLSFFNMLALAAVDHYTEIDNLIARQQDEYYEADKWILYILFFFIIPVIRDYSLALRQENFSALFALQKRLLIIFVELKSPQYTVAILLSQLLFQYWVDSCLPIVKLFSTRPSAFNEDKGETSFGILANSVIGDTYTDPVKHLGLNFKLIPRFKQNAKTFIENSGVSRQKEVGNRNLSPNNFNVVKLKDYLKTLLIDLHTERWRYYLWSPTLFYITQDSLMCDAPSTEMLFRDSTQDNVLFELNRALRLHWSTSSIDNRFLHYSFPKTNTPSEDRRELDEQQAVELTQSVEEYLKSIGKPLTDQQEQEQRIGELGRPRRQKKAPHGRSEPEPSSVEANPALHIVSQDHYYFFNSPH